MKIYLVLVIARQQDGEYVFVNVEKVYKDKLQAEKYAASKKAREPVVLEGMQCLAERGIIEADLE